MYCNSRILKRYYLIDDSQWMHCCSTCIVNLFLSNRALLESLQILLNTQSKRIWRRLLSQFLSPIFFIIFMIINNSYFVCNHFPCFFLTKRGLELLSGRAVCDPLSPTTIESCVVCTSYNKFASSICRCGWTSESLLKWWALALVKTQTQGGQKQRLQTQKHGGIVFLFDWLKCCGEKRL